MIAKGDDTQATVILESLKFLAKHTQALTSNGVEEMAERLQLISDMSDYMMNFPIEKLRKLSAKVLATKIKPRTKKRSRCYNCKFAGKTFKIGNMTHLYCQNSEKYPKEKFESGELDPLEAMKSFSETCSYHTFSEKQTP